MCAWLALGNAALLPHQAKPGSTTAAQSAGNQFMPQCTARRSCAAPHHRLVGQQTGPGGGGGKGGNSKGSGNKQGLFLIYLDALSVTNPKRASAGGIVGTAVAALASGCSQQLASSSAGITGIDDGSTGDDSAAGAELLAQQQLALERRMSAAAPNMPEMTMRDLQFVLTFTGVTDCPTSASAAACAVSRNC